MQSGFPISPFVDADTLGFPPPGAATFLVVLGGFKEEKHRNIDVSSF